MAKANTNQFCRVTNVFSEVRYLLSPTTTHLIDWQRKILEACVQLREL